MTYQITVNYRPVPVQQYDGKSYAWFAFSPPADVTITATYPIGAYRLAPSGNALRQSARDRSLSFRLNEPGHLALK